MDSMRQVLQDQVHYIDTINEVTCVSNEKCARFKIREVCLVYRKVEVSVTNLKHNSPSTLS